MNFAILTSGGDAPGMNAAIRSFVRRGLADGHKIWGIPRGFDGLVNGKPEKLTRASVADILMTGGTILRTSRFIEFHQAAVRIRAVEAISRWHFDGLAVIGGNGSLAGAYALSQMGIPVVGIPASIDNDVPQTDYSIGFDTAMNNIVASIDKIRDTASAHERIFVVEVMGNHCGALAVASGLACGAEAIIIPERVPDWDAIAKRLRATYARGKRHSFIIVAEGAKDAPSVALDLGRRTGHEAKWVVLGHTQRGGPPSAQDRIRAALFASEAVQVLATGQAGVMVGWRRAELNTVPLATVVSNVSTPPLPWQDLAELLAR